MNFRFITLLISALTLLAFSATAQPSVLSKGDFYKIAVSKNGIYKIDRAFLADLGIDVSKTDPRNIRIYGYGGGMLPQANAVSRPWDLSENAIFVKGETDGSFDADDYLLFYAEGADRIYYDVFTDILRHEKNIYADKNYYFLTVADTPGKRITQQPSSTGSPSIIVTTFDEVVYHDEETDVEGNLLNSGRDWYGEKFDYQLEHSFKFPMEGRLETEPVKMLSNVFGFAPSDFAQGTKNPKFTFQLNDKVLGEQEINSVSSEKYARKGDTRNAYFSTLIPAAADLTVKVRYDKMQNNSTYGRLDFLVLNAQRRLQLYANQTIFRSLASRIHSFSQFQVGNVSASTMVWDISQPSEVKNQNFELSASTLTFRAATRSLKEFVVFQGSNFEAPQKIGKIKNQNLHGMTAPELLIISAENFLTDAQRLADFRKNNDKLTVGVVTVDQIYNEFSSGRQDITAIRDFIRLLYKPSGALKYVLLFGDASYDYKERSYNKTNFVPVYESRESLHPIYSYSSDDYYGFLEEHEGDWEENDNNDHTLEIGIGRLPVKNLREAKAVVDKLIYYSTNSNTLGSWRNRICFIADDGDENTHQRDADLLAGKVDTTFKWLNIKKIYVDAFPKTADPTGKKSPAARSALNKEIDNGALIVNYTGHGSEGGWTSEGILVSAQVTRWENLDRMPLFVTATCEFGRYDNPGQTSGAEYAILNPAGGAIAMLTTTRPVYSSSNFVVNTAFYRAVFTPVGGQMPRLGDVMRLTKNNSIDGIVNRNFSLLGDPSMRLAYPQQEIVVTSIKNADGSEAASLRGLSKVTVTGEVRKENTLNSAFSGTLEAVIYDKKSKITTLGDEAPKMTFEVQDKVIYRGTASIRNGRFEFSFVVPKDIYYQPGNGKISLYATADDRKTDATGYNRSIQTGGSDPAAVTDNKAPQIALFMDSEKFVSGGTVGQNTELIAKLSDDNGINISGIGIAHDITAVLDDTVAMVLNDYYQAERDNFANGTVRFSFQGLSQGWHTLTLKAWDTHNNSATAAIKFYVNIDAFSFISVMHYPNPLEQEMHFKFRHNKPGQNLDVSWQLYSGAGKLIRAVRQQIYNSTEEIDLLTWNGRDENGARPAAGIYFYRIVAITADGTTRSHSGKIVVPE